MAEPQYAEYAMHRDMHLHMHMHLHMNMLMQRQRTGVFSGLQCFGHLLSWTFDLTVNPPPPPPPYPYPPPPGLGSSTSTIKFQKILFCVY